MYHGDGEFDTFLSLLMMLKPTAESLDSCLIPAPFCVSVYQGDGEIDMHSLNTIRKTNQIPFP